MEQETKRKSNVLIFDNANDFGAIMKCLLLCIVTIFSEKVPCNTDRVMRWNIKFNDERFWTEIKQVQDQDTPIKCIQNFFLYFF